MRPSFFLSLHTGSVSLYGTPPVAVSSSSEGETKTKVDQKFANYKLESHLILVILKKITGLRSGEVCSSSDDVNKGS